MEDFPAKSPDLNAIEYVWGWVKHSVAAREPHNYETLQAAILAAWDELPQTTIRHFIDHINSVIEEIIAGRTLALTLHGHISEQLSGSLTNIQFESRQYICLFVLRMQDFWPRQYI